MLRSALLAAALVLPVSIAACSAQGDSEIAVEDAYARETIGAAPNTAGFATITNTGSGDDQLIAAASPVAGKAELHTTLQENGVMQMRPVEGIDIPAGGEVSLAPGGYHIMLLNVTGPLKAGTTIPVTLSFKNAGEIETEFSVVAIGGGMPHDTMDHGEMGDHGAMSQGDMQDGMGDMESHMEPGSGNHSPMHQ